MFDDQHDWFWVQLAGLSALSLVFIVLRIRNSVRSGEQRVVEHRRAVKAGISIKPRLRSGVAVVLGALVVILVEVAKHFGFHARAASLLGAVTLLVVVVVLVSDRIPPTPAPSSDPSDGRRDA
jgi:Na+/H+ antiporter NhaD/arsenite permease-like protein